MNYLFLFTKQSLILDFRFFFTSRWLLSQKVEFILKKYLILIYHMFRKFQLGKDFTVLSGRKIYYANKFGIADYQGMLTRHQSLLKIAGVKVKRDGVIVDVGANVGIFSRLVRELYPKASVYSLEPVPDIFACLGKNFLQDQNIKIFNIALGNRKGKHKMFFSNQNSEMSKIDTKGNVSVNVDTLDNFIKENKVKLIDLLKIDTEGFEQIVLEGAVRTLAKTRYLFIEIAIEDNKNYTISSLMSHLCSDDFNFNLVAFRNFADTSEGKAPILDCLMRNVKL